METDTQLVSGSEQFISLAQRLAVKTVLKSALWFGAAWVAVYFSPSWAPWPWYIAFGFVLIGFAAALLAWIGFLRARRAEQHESSNALDV